MRRRLVVLGALAAFAAACTIVNGLSVSTMPSTGTADGDADGGADAFVDPYPCNHAYPPARPGPGSAAGNKSFYSALHKIDLGARDGGEPEVVGFDLDKICTCGGSGAGGPAPESCVSAGAATGTPLCDGDGGIDNSATSLFQTALNVGIDLADDLSSDLGSGAHGVLLWVSNYNGLDNDPDVDVGLIVASGIESGNRPKFDGTEAWTVPMDQVLTTNDGFIPRTVKGYVANNQLVVQAAFKIPLLGGISVHLNQAYLVGTIAPAGGTFQIIDGILIGRAPVDEVIRSIGGIETPKGSGTHLCDTTQLKDMQRFNGLKMYVCANLDTRQNPDQDNTGLPCDAISMGIRFTAVPATLGSLRELSSVTYCADADVTCPTN